MVYGELGVYNIEIAIQIRMISFWLKLASDVNRNKLSVQLYDHLKSVHGGRSINVKWLDYVKGILDKCGFSCFWENIDNVNTKLLLEAIKMNLQDQYKQTWLENICE